MTSSFNRKLLQKKQVVGNNEKLQFELSQVTHQNNQITNYCEKLIEEAEKREQLFNQLHADKDTAVEKLQAVATEIESSSGRDDHQREHLLELKRTLANHERVRESLKEQIAAAGKRKRDAEGELGRSHFSPQTKMLDAKLKISKLFNDIQTKTFLITFLKNRLQQRVDESVKSRVESAWLRFQDFIQGKEQQLEVGSCNILIKISNNVFRFCITSGSTSH